MAGLVGEMFLSLGYLFSDIRSIKATGRHDLRLHFGGRIALSYSFSYTIYLFSTKTSNILIGDIRGDYWFLRDGVPFCLLAIIKFNDIFACPYSLLCKCPHIEPPKNSIN
jgi:hypothetical protein